MRSSVVPQTTAKETAQKTNSNHHLAEIPTLENARPGKSLRTSELFSAKPVLPMIEPAPPEKPSANPTAQKTTAQIEKFIRILATTVPTFFWREKPISKNANPACMNITRIAATTTQIVSVARLLAAMLWWRLVSLSVTEPSTAGSMPALVLSGSRLFDQQMAPVRGPALRHTYREADGHARHWPPVQNLAHALVRVAQRFPKAPGTRRSATRLGCFAVWATH